MLYHLYDWNHAVIRPLRAAVNINRFLLDHAGNPFAGTYAGKVASAAFEVFDRVTKRYGKPSFGIDSIDIGGQSAAVAEEVERSLPFCDLLHFQRAPEIIRSARRSEDPRVLLVAPLSGHYATLLRGTVRALLPAHDVYVTDWRDARDVALNVGSFDLDDYIDYVIEFIRHLGTDVHVIAVCQPGPAVVAATALMSAAGDPCVPASVTLMGSPIDTRMSPTKPNLLAVSKPLNWFERNVIMNVPFPNPGFMRRVYPGFLQLTGFMTMNLDRHLSAHHKLYSDLVVGDGDSAKAHRKFYDEYLGVMDLTAEYYLQTIDVVFQQHALPDGRMFHRGVKVDTAAIRHTALMTVEGELDDISGIGQTQAAHELFGNVPDSKQIDYIQDGVGHYGVFNGSRWRAEIAPRTTRFIQSNRR
ncbi:MAG: polyhydroxyalkanoate depolymerase [Gammaproteobacteria bacterium]|nr:polyhydroxyalkanoate depolymerase [Gammaproteobacteria bacterium]